MSLDAEDYKNQYFEEKFRTVNNQFDAMKQYFGEKLENIERQTKKTNGSLNEHNQRLRHIENVQNSCPIDILRKEQEKLKNETDSIRFFYRNPKMLRGYLVGTTFISLLAFILVFLRIINYI